MLVLKRKAGESITIGDDIVVKVTSCSSGFTKIGIEAPANLPILRSELHDSGGLRFTNLSSDAFGFARNHGHLIQWQRSELSQKNKVRYGSCIHEGCSAWVTIDYNPVYVGPRIEGPAIALDCPACQDDCT